ncbi:MAG: hypothetical protein NUV87_03005 [Candidatus Roizmanbacteria bacterium]|nr:hypothetical protein [Candidatus Roizmanbacteria bacterium]MCR4313201.1 hypothetical protein [Candidatus Roizmanbacteria bacterium]
MSKQNLPQYFVSTDSIGFLGGPEQFVYIWKEYFDDKTLTGVEAIAFKSIKRLGKLISILQKNNIPVVSFHGRTGGENQLDLLGKIVMSLVNLEIVDIENLLKYFPEIEFLSHGPYFEEESKKQIVIKYQPNKIWIENHLSGKRGVEDAIKQINIYRENNINTSGMLDVYHYVANSVTTLETNWPKIVDELKTYILLKDKNGRQLFNGIHFPIGSRLGDSLPVDDMTDQMLKIFAQKIIPNVERVVFENQQTNIGLFFSTNGMLQIQKERNRRIIERLKKTGIIC